MLGRLPYRAAVLLVFVSYCALLGSLRNGDLGTIQHILAPLSGRSRYENRPCGSPVCVTTRLIATPHEVLRAVVAALRLNTSVVSSLRLRPSAGDPAATRQAVHEAFQQLAAGEQLHLAIELEGIADVVDVDQACHAVWSIAVATKRWVQVQFVALPSPFSLCAGDYAMYDRWIKTEGALTEAHLRSLRASKNVVWFSNTAISQLHHGKASLFVSPNRILPILRAASMPVSRSAQWFEELAAMTPAMRPSFLFNSEDVLIIATIPAVPVAEFLRRALRCNIAPLALVIGVCGECVTNTTSHASPCPSWIADGRGYVEWSGLTNVGEPIQRTTLVVCLVRKRSDSTNASLDSWRSFSAADESCVIDVSPSISSAAVVG